MIDNSDIDKVFKDQKAIDRIRFLIHRRLGIHIKEGKESLLRQRLWKLILNNEYQDLNHLCDEIERAQDSNILLRLATLISTNHTYFFRESTHFDFLQTTIVPNLIPENGKIRFWSAAASSGEEAYSLCMILAEIMGIDRFSREVALLGTDISQKVLDAAEKGIYTVENFEKIPSMYRMNYTEAAGHEGFFQIKQVLRNACLFRRLNLNMCKYPFKQKFHVIFCRNLFIYFDHDTQEAICNEFARVSMPDAWLFISQTETLRNLNVPWKYVNPGIYRKTLNPHYGNQ